MGAISETEDLVNEIKGKRILHWNYRGLARLPDAMRSCASDISEIYLKDNKITYLPDWINELVNLTHLYLHGNSLKKVPAELARMTNLTLLDLSENGLEALPSCVGELAALECLTIDNNYLKKLPTELLGLKNLRLLSISNNEFVALPEWLGSFEKLEQLRADDNVLEELPNRLTLAPVLCSISVCSNRLSYLPLNGFASCPSIYFRYNSYLNYLSYPVFLQLLGTVGSAGIALGQSHTAKKRYNVKNLQISVSHDNEGGYMVVELPRQLLRVHGVDVRKPVRLWELALRRIYCKREPTKCKEDRGCLGVSYNLLTNGPIAVCVNVNCLEPIFTEAWLIAATCQQDYDSTDVPVVLLYCSQRYADLCEIRSNRGKPTDADWADWQNKFCARNFDSLPDGLEALRWQLVLNR